MHCFATPAHGLPIANNATLLRLQTAVVLRVPVGEDSVATDACGIRVCTNIPAHIVKGGTLILVFTDYITLCICVIGRNILNLDTENINR